MDIQTISTQQLQFSSIADSTALLPIATTPRSTDFSHEEPHVSLGGELLVMKLLLERMSGKRIELYQPEEGSHTESSPTSDSSSMFSVNMQQSFELHASLQTLQGDQIRLDLRVESAFSVTLEQGRSDSQEPPLTDPLVINLNRDFVDLEQGKFYFDLNGDGLKDWVAKLAEGSYFLALDRNQNQRIDDGSELFGPRSGDGFTDLSVYDEDQNGQIDANDSIYGQLKLWRPDGSLLAIADLGVKSISLHAQDVVRDYHDAEGQLIGRLRKSAAVEHESGVQSTAQHIDLRI